MAAQSHVDLGTLSDLATPWCLRVVATLRIADRIADGTTDLAGLAAAAGCDAAALQQVLDHLVGVGVFSEPQPGTFALNDVGRELLDPAQLLMLDLNGIGGRFAHAWSTLLGYVRTGTPAYHEVFGRPFWDDLEANPAIGASFDALMGPDGHGAPDSALPLSGGWTKVRSVVDVGGGTGALLAGLLRSYPDLYGTLVDLPDTVARAGATFEAAGVADRVGVRGQSFFDALPPGADVYILSKVLNDWPDRETIAILRRCAEAADPAGRLLIAGGVVADGERRGISQETVLLGGRSNTLSEFRALAQRAGLEVANAEQQRSGRLVVECRPS